MKLKLAILFFIFLLSGNFVHAQVENVIVERYYVSDSSDASDTTGGFLEEGSVTYRVFIDMMPGTKLLKIYGDVNHALRISSTACFFNNKADGETFAKDFSKTRLQENTVALDSWITLGQATRVASKTYFGVLKTDDNDGSIIGGTNNDGGSSAIPGGLLTNANTSAGIPITTSDGLDTMTNIPSSWVDNGFENISTGTDSTIFGSLVAGTEFISYDAALQNSGVTGVDPVKNQVLVAQLTTKGEISFELNVEVEENYGSGTRIIKYVANADVLLPDERLSAFLKYPPTCGCTDPNFLEYNPVYSCNNSDSCRTLIKYGCMDSLACNYDHEANFNIPELCCYPGYCNDRDLDVVCPQLTRGKYKDQHFELFPNPTTGQLNVQRMVQPGTEFKYEIYDSSGRLVVTDNSNTAGGKFNLQVDVSKFENGIYLFRAWFNDESESKIFIKE